MFDWISKKRREKKRKDAHERELKKTLASKLANYENYNDPTQNDFTEIAVGGKKLRVAKEHITINDLWSEQNSKPPK